MLIFDNLHGYIEVSNLAKSIIDTSEFQRLRNIHQTGALYYVFPTAVHTRYEHSLGTYHLTGMLLEKIKNFQPELELDNKLIEFEELKAYNYITKIISDNMQLIRRPVFVYEKKI